MVECVVSDVLPYYVKLVSGVPTTGAAVTTNLDLNDGVTWCLLEGSRFDPPQIDRAVVNTLLTDGDRYPAGIYHNRTLRLKLLLQGTSPDDLASRAQTLYRELNRATNTLLYQPQSSSPVYFRTYRVEPSAIDVIFREQDSAILEIDIPADPFAYGPEELGPPFEILNDPDNITYTSTFLDTYSRTVSGSWGTGDSGHVTSSAGGVASEFVVNGATGQHSLSLTNDPHTTTYAGVALRDADIVVTLSTGAAAISGAGILGAVNARIVDAANGYQFQVRFETDQSVSALIIKRVAGVATTLTSGTAPAMSYATNRQFKIKARLSSSSLRMKIWTPATQTEPTTWLISVLDNTYGSAGDVAIVSQRNTGNTNGTTTVSYDDLSATAVRGVYFEVTGVKGDVETPLIIRVAHTPSGVAGTRTVMGLRRRGDPSRALPTAQMESAFVTLSTDTTLQPYDSAMSGMSAGGNFVRCTFATSQVMQMRLSFTNFPVTGVSPYPGDVNWRGTYRALLRYRRSNASDVIRLQWTTYINGAQIVNTTVTTQTSASIWYADMGLVPVPGGIDQIAYGLSNAEILAGAIDFSIAAQRVSGSGSIDLDCIIFVPADDTFSIVEWSPWSGPWADVMDGVNEIIYSVSPGSSGVDVINPEQPAQLTGGFFSVSPGQTNRITFVANGGGLTSVGGGQDDLRTSVFGRASYYPRYVHVRPVTT